MLQWIKKIAQKFIQYKWLLVAMCLHVVVAFYFIAQQNITYDEPGYIEYSKRWLQGKPERVEALDDSKTPVISIVWVPRIIRQVINPNYQLNDFGRQDQREGRYMLIVFSLLTMLYLYKFIQLFNLKNGWLIFFFFLLDPLIVAYAVIINSDLLSGLLLLAIVYHLYKLSMQKSHQQFLLVCLLMGIALVTKHTFLFGLPLLIAAFIKVYKRQSVVKIFVAIGILLLVINLAFYFHHSGKSLGNYHFKSSLFNTIQQQLSLLSWLPIPVPETYIQSIDLLQYHAQLDGSVNNTYTGVYVLEKVNLQTGFWYYYAVVAFYKIPLALWCLFIIGLGRWMLQFKQYKQQFYFLIIPIVYFVWVLSLFNQFQIGIRHLLLVIPLLYVLLAMVVNQLAESTTKYFVGVLVVFMLYSVVRYYPDLIPYTNELVANKTTVYKKMMDSSIDYGQSDSTATEFLKLNKDYSIPTSTPTKGKFILSMHQYIEQYKQGDTSLHWLLKKHKPIELLKHVYWLYEVK